MEHGRYDMTLEDVPGMILSIRQTGVPVGLTATHTEPGFLLSDGTALLECEKDENGFYVGGAGMDGMYLKTGRLYEPVRDEDGAVTGTPDRSTLRAVQTPQVFETDLLKAALQSALENEVPVTDDCSAVERLGKMVYLIDGDEENLKITTPVDLVIAEAILAEREGR